VNGGVAHFQNLLSELHLLARDGVVVVEPTQETPAGVSALNRENYFSEQLNFVSVSVAFFL
jgi:hypothetical protein